MVLGGRTYTVQIINWARDGGQVSVNLNSAGGNTGTLHKGSGAGTPGQIITGEFTALTTSQDFTWAGATGAAFTVMGAISVLDITAAIPEPSALELPGLGVCLAAIILFIRRRAILPRCHARDGGGAGGGVQINPRSFFVDAFGKPVRMCVFAEGNAANVLFQLGYFHVKKCSHFLFTPFQKCKHEHSRVKESVNISQP
ncbi:MAG: hypothetical protein LBD30_01255 [Verrucomicrobiales bacterium]|jgi:hypothetical protein|nr:hypothetical protein [Verrucomicrobiales bacterium]